MAKQLRTQILGLVFLVSSVWLFVTLFLFDIEDEINKTRLRKMYPNVVNFVNVIKKHEPFGNSRDKVTKSQNNRNSSNIKHQEDFKRKEILQKWREELLLKERKKEFVKDIKIKTDFSRTREQQIKQSANIEGGRLNNSDNLSQRIPVRPLAGRATIKAAAPSVGRVSERERLRHLERVAPLDAPGEFGRPVVIKMADLSPEQQKLHDLLFKRNSFDQYASDMISLHRRLPDIRSDSCKQKTYSNNLPSTSIIICFHNEAWSVLLRTVHSILNRSPPDLIHEILLVDDFSDLDFLKTELDEYFAENGMGKVRVIRTARREGLIRARLLGYEKATGKILTFLDSHIECFQGWLEPLLARIAENHTRVVAPVIDMISDRTLACGGAEIAALGTFDIANMGYKWLTINKTEKAKHEPSEPWRTPTIAGGLFAISRAYFTDMGTYDDGMDIWGGENLEISFRVWMCGGSLEIHPCSHVAHIFRSVSPYKWGKSFGEILRKNSVRTAEVWMDEYKHIYYERLNYNLGDYGDISYRKDLRRRLRCKSFGWYLQTLLPSMEIPEKNLYSGEVRNMESGLCLDTMGTTSGNRVQAIPCHHLGGNQFFRFTVSGLIERDSACLTNQKGALYYVLCKNNATKWEYTESEIRVLHSKSCLSLNHNTLSVLPCVGLVSQKWAWSRKIEENAPVQ
uniref:Polypeptide N-acetylgalactosaminyltransferase n=1 Tax=Crassostrea virginica TaxID=6565 RepID=A0A8B8BWP9_CRAVI|nr:polypeptide N-acetylgalactosaminyltransferase 1-like isoform X2 [Crassostrea virginica]